MSTKKIQTIPVGPLVIIAMKNIEPLAEKGLFTRQSGRWVLTPTGFLMSNQIIVRLQEAQENSEPLAKKR